MTSGISWDLCERESPIQRDLPGPVDKVGYWRPHVAHKCSSEGGPSTPMALVDVAIALGKRKPSEASSKPEIIN